MQAFAAAPAELLLAQVVATTAAVVAVSWFGIRVRVRGQSQALQWCHSGMVVMVITYDAGSIAWSCGVGWQTVAQPVNMYFTKIGMYVNATAASLIQELAGCLCCCVGSTVCQTGSCGC
jgi:hypothetical protein